MFSRMSNNVIVFVTKSKIQFDTNKHKAKIITVQYIHVDQSKKKKHSTTESDILVSRLFLVIRLTKRFRGVYVDGPFA